tara:strand:- start:163 stop:459 length:297 start_codon:yes stop_codon:yes gene_type:complete
MHTQDHRIESARAKSFFPPPMDDQPGYVVDALRRIESATPADLRDWGVPLNPVDDGHLVDDVVQGALGEDYDDLTKLDTDDLAELREAADRRLTPMYR